MEVFLLSLVLVVFVGWYAGTIGRSVFGWVLLSLLISPIISGIILFMLGRPTDNIQQAKQVEFDISYNEFMDLYFERHENVTEEQRMMYNELISDRDMTGLIIPLKSIIKSMRK